MNRVRELAQLDKSVAEIALQLLERLVTALVTAAQPLPRQGKFGGQSHQILLESVMQVPLNPLSLGVLRLGDALP